jgi:hypothetical protein
MPRGSKPGERRGRQRATPNRRTVLTNRILATGANNPASTANKLVRVLARSTVACGHMARSVQGVALRLVAIDAQPLGPP